MNKYGYNHFHVNLKSLSKSDRIKHNLLYTQQAKESLIKVLDSDTTRINKQIHGTISHYKVCKCALCKKAAKKYRDNYQKQKNLK